MSSAEEGRRTRETLSTPLPYDCIKGINAVDRMPEEIGVMRFGRAAAVNIAPQHFANFRDDFAMPLEARTVAVLGT